MINFLKKVAHETGFICESSLSINFLGNLFLLSSIWFTENSVIKSI